MAITPDTFADYLKQNEWPRADATAQDLGRDIEVILNGLLDRVSAGTVTPRPPPRRPEEVLALVSFFVHTAQPPLQSQTAG